MPWRSSQRRRTDEEGLTIIGKSLPRIDGEEKVTGFGKCAADLSLPGMLWCKLLRSPHAKIFHLDTARAKRPPGVKAVITGKDFRGFCWGWTPETRDESSWPLKTVKYVGKGVAVVAAVDENTAEEAFRRSDLIPEDKFVTARVARNCLEPPAILAYYDPKGSITLWALKQSLTSSTGT